MEILYEDTQIIVCVKPAGIASETRQTGQQDMVSLLRNYLHEKGEEPYIGLIHRLDQPVEGILVFGKHSRATAALSRQLRQGGFSKIYLAVTEGAMPAQEGRLLDYLKKDAGNNRSIVTERTEPRAKKAELIYRVLKTDESCSPVQNLVKIRLLTGRHHQIRVQMAHLGVPLAGDRKYGAQGLTQKTGEHSGLALCACELEFLHPGKKTAMKFEIQPSQPAFRKFVNAS